MKRAPGDTYPKMPDAEEDVALEQLRRHLKTALATVLELQRLYRQVERLEQEPVANAYALDQSYRKLDQLVERLGDAFVKADAPEMKGRLAHRLTERKAKLEPAKDKFRAQFGTELEKTLRERLDLSLRGQYPRLLAGMYTIIPDFGRGAASIFFGPDQELLTKARLTPQDVAGALEKAHKSLTARAFNPEEFQSRLRQAYTLALKRAGRRAPDKVPILDVLRELVALMQDRRYYSDPSKEHYKEYRRAAFSYDLYRLQRRTAGTDGPQLTIATREHTTKREGFLWVPTDDQGAGTAFAYLSFREVKEQ